MSPSVIKGAAILWANCRPPRACPAPLARPFVPSFCGAVPTFPLPFSSFPLLLFSATYLDGVLILCHGFFHVDELVSQCARAPKGRVHDPRIRYPGPAALQTVRSGDHRVPIDFSNVGPDRLVRRRHRHRHRVHHRSHRDLRHLRHLRHRDSRAVWPR